MTPTRLVKHRDKIVSIPVGTPKTVDNIFFNDLQGFDMIISSIIKEKETNGITFAMKLLGSYKFFYNLTDREIQNFAYLTGIVAPYDSTKLENIEADIYKIIFPKFTSKYQDLTELTKQNWLEWKISIFKDYIRNGVNDSNHNLLKVLKKDKKDVLNKTLDNLINEKCFDNSVKFNPFIGFFVSKPMDKGQLLAIDDTGNIQVIEEENKDKYIPIGTYYMDKRFDGNKVVRLNQYLASLLIFVDSVLNKSILKFMNEKNMSYLDEFKETSFTVSDGGKKKIKKKSLRKSAKKSKKIKKFNIIKNDIKKNSI